MRIATWVLVVGALAACTRKEPERTPGSAKTAPLIAADAGSDAGADGGKSAAAFIGTVRGIVKLAPGASVPLAPPILNHGVKPPSLPPCPPVDENDQRAVTQAKETGGLSPIHVALTGMTSVPAAEPRTHELFIDACRIRPTLVGARKGDPIKLTNRSEPTLIPQIPDTKFMRGLLRGDSETFDATRVQTRVQCAYGNYCGQTLVIATTHTLYDVTSEHGFFTIEHVPLDQPLKVHAWHPLFDENSVKVTLSKDKPEQMVEILLTPSKAVALPNKSK